MSRPLDLVCAAASSEETDLARAAAAALGLPWVDELDLNDATQYSHALLYRDQAWQLQELGSKTPGPVWVDFASGAVAHRRQFGGGVGQMVAKACGLQKGKRPRVADVTAGLGRDAFVLATLGCPVQMVERSALVAWLLRDGLERGRDLEDLAPILSRMELHQAEGVEWLRRPGWTEPPEVVYLDPMFPHSDKSAQVKKEMLAFRSLVGADEDADALLQAALEVAVYRVVVKRPRKAPDLQGPKPSVRLEGKSCRYDIYALKRMD
ncbi:class I SAM-dependent methyltransferase [Nitrincola tapanii]|uniref:Ribosomal RNA small subunit methyltransferase J n=1 Tax=Nitrincola tapanii TaxID=1708751 RepID=A0A5A9W0W2_9GAMM|nr:class I SAM-dependent methyltransferase [Nitrincola tapanii]KAA0873859.1 SAM-dependent methyltransferase [Nitrincola tapanii]